VERPDPSPVDAEQRPTSAETQQHSDVIERLFREHNEALIRFLLSRLHSYQEALEVAQEAYVKLLSLDTPSAISYQRAFLFRTAANLAVDRQRRGIVHARATRSPLFHEFSDPRTPERHVAATQQVDRLRQMLETLPPKCRQAFVLVRFHGLDFAEAAQRMGLKERMIRIYVERALLHCRELMDRHEGPGHE
jgi:RNA polymerase sigma-70 factor (ECF subfamily)